MDRAAQGRPVRPDGGLSARPSSVGWLAVGLFAGLLAWEGLSVAPAAAADLGDTCPSANILSALLTTVCWECLFPVDIAGVVADTGGQEATPPAEGQTGTLCFCCDNGAGGGGSCLPSVPFGWWEPVRIVEIVRDPYCFPSFGTDLDNKASPEHAGSRDAGETGPDTAQAFAQAHLIQAPLLGLTSLVIESFCKNGTYLNSLDVLYLTEVDPTWDDDVAAGFTAPEGVLVSTPVAQAACALDAVAASAGWPIDAMFWCAGSWGSLYPHDGFFSTTAHGLSGVAALETGRLLAHLARMGTEWYTAGTGDQICYDIPTFLVVKSQYKFQLLWPVANTGVGEGEIGCCFPFGRAPFFWALLKDPPGQEAGRIFLIWKRQNCCLDIGL